MSGVLNTKRRLLSAEEPVFFPKPGTATRGILFMRGYLMMHVLWRDMQGLRANNETCYSTQLWLCLPSPAMMNGQTDQCVFVFASWLRLVGGKKVNNQATTKIICHFKIAQEGKSFKETIRECINFHFCVLVMEAVVGRAGWKELQMGLFLFLQTIIIEVENGSCDSFGPLCNTSGPGEINFIEVKVKELRSVLTTFLPIESAWNVCKDSIRTGFYTPGDKKKKKNKSVSIGNPAGETAADVQRLELCRCSELARKRRRIGFLRNWLLSSGSAERKPSFIW